MSLLDAAARFFRIAVKRGGGADARTTIERADWPAPNQQVGDLRRLHLPDVDGSKESKAKAARLAGLSDERLLRAVFKPTRGAHVTIIRSRGRVDDGNHRVAELHERNPASTSIAWDTPVYINFVEGYRWWR
jgi:hypothetical protein